MPLLQDVQARLPLYLEAPTQVEYMLRLQPSHIPDLLCLAAAHIFFAACLIARFRTSRQMKQAGRT
jgi:hypothetical protein